ncbi:uncharacterized protein N7479_009501 [Penicillium vulpinum]|uniref:Carrier domain-containing protein n=1 Tax=Penicillium vulpinum TaxID=29845 RepID=A0A1V6RYL6_9EURO|nr:uncharacterized protein N7479_009501 [Penicillium vulpinum]KAJ5951088.1 hypothetical protein N7479_009501 [Penicillium vulpinum]OQE06845.1 hypothetical protein PENVUL_c016G07472 [Penicillium vulpinum]
MSSEPIAIIGTGCRLPGESTSPAKLWSLLKEPRDVLTKISETRFNPDGFYHPTGKNPSTSRVTESYLLSEDIRCFDAQFFNINPVEAEAIDPQQRVLLETVYEAIDSAGLPLADLNGSDTAVYVGVMREEYSLHLRQDPNVIPTYTATGTERSILVNRISYFFNWHGPSMAIDTACSSSLVALHEAVKSLRSGECRIAVAAGTNLILRPETYAALNGLNMVSPSGRSRMWDVDADGYGRGEGVGAVILKTLSAAIADGDHIECIVRETGVNQDGRTSGITVPSQKSQTALIQETYRKAGLNPFKVADRCQFFEAHGTGTPAGDPIEAEAIHRAFFSSASAKNDTLYVGSVKTVCGHTEGTAGIAAVIKASLALQHGIIPPNMLLNELHPKVKPFSDHLQVPMQAISWPAVEKGQPRRASVNNFGFGGTNAHAILESYEAASTTTAITTSHNPVFNPFVFSAASEKSLDTMLSAYSTWLHNLDESSINLRDLSYTLSSRKSELAFKAAISASSVETLCHKLASKQTDITRGSQIPARILGIFTGQGAQWAGMGKSLIISCAFVRERIAHLQNTLYSLPNGDRPSWSIMEELLAAPEDSKLHEASISQPLCTAIQIVLVDLLRGAGISFHSVVGHSSGEIAAAYAAGFLSAEDAMKVAYYRGFHAKLARSSNGKPGAMMAVATTWEDANEICNLEQFEGRICMAASNSMTSVTLSGDADAIEEALEILQEENKFSKILEVDTAYHSHHMLPCAEPYRISIQNSNIQLSPGNLCRWFSSVRNGDRIETADGPDAAYWTENMISTVQFSRAIQQALDEEDPFNHVLEIGPHPALRGPAQQIIQASQGEQLPYSGLLHRDLDGLESVSKALGNLWKHHGSKAVDFASYDSIMSGPDLERPRQLNNLPPYPWDHDRSFWFESRASRVNRLRSDPFHDILGTREVNTMDELRWRNTLKVSDIPWVKGHQVQRQILFPGAGYAVAAIEAAQILAKGEDIIVIELLDLAIHRATSFDDENAAVETLVTLSRISRRLGAISADFQFHAAPNAGSDTLALTSSCQIHISLGTPSLDSLPIRSVRAPNLVDVPTDLFYKSLGKLGYGYSGPFRALSSLQRSYKAGTGLVGNPQRDIGGDTSPLLIHPAILDSSFQAACLAFCHPSDGGLHRLHVPVHIRCIRINHSACQKELADECNLAFDSLIPDSTPPSFEADVGLFSVEGTKGNALVHIEGLELAPVSDAAEENYRAIFSTMQWGLAAPDGNAAASAAGVSFDAHRVELATVAAQGVLYYLQHLTETITETERAKATWFHQRIFPFAEDVISRAMDGTHPCVKKKWIQNDREHVYRLMDKFSDDVLIKMIKVVGENLPAAVRGDINILEHMMHGGLLDKFYTDSLGVKESTSTLAQMVNQIVHRHPNLDIIEIGAGTGGATKAIFDTLDAFDSYTFTDVSSGFFEKAQQILGKWENHAKKMKFSTLDIEKDVTSQGYTPGSYDLVVASSVLHVTASLEETMKNIRQLLKPGGYLVILELTSVEKGTPAFGFIFSGLPGWWLGVNDNRLLSPLISPQEWDPILRSACFSGVDTVTPIVSPLACPIYVMATQAVDDHVLAVRQPLESPPTVLNGTLAILCGSTEVSRSRAEAIAALLQPWYHHVLLLLSVEELAQKDLKSCQHFLSISDLDEPLFQNLSDGKINYLKAVFDKFILGLWVTQGCQTDPYANMTIGVGRSVVNELSHLRLQFLNIEPGQPFNVALLANTFLRLRMMDEWDHDHNTAMLYSIEPEISHQNGFAIIPRLRNLQAANDRYNSSRHPITVDRLSDEATITLVQSHEGCTLMEDLGFLSGHTDSEELITIRVEKSTMISIGPLNARQFVVIGNILSGDRSNRAIAFANKQSSTVQTYPPICRSCHIAPGSEARLLLFMISEYLLQYLSAIGDGPVVLHNPDSNLAWALSQSASQRGLSLVFTSSIHATDKIWSHINPYISDQSLRRIIPFAASCFIDFTRSEDQCNLAPRIRNAISRTCKCLTMEDIFGTDAVLPTKVPVELGKLFETITLRAISVASNVEDSPEIDTILLRDLIEPRPVEKGCMTMVDWTLESKISVRLQPIDSRVLFAADKTYVLFGLTSDLGQALAQWMVEYGARYIVLASRRPKIEPAWLEKMREMGATVQVYFGDVGNRTELEEVCLNIRSSMPEIKGIFNGAMVLMDAIVANLSIEIVEQQMKPKVDGSRFLDEIFSGDDLDFFVCVSSIGAIWGNGGQTIYSASNMYMTALAYQRRARGLPASILHLGSILAAGYLARQDVWASLNWSENSGHQWLSERDVHTAFAEAILASRPDSGVIVEIVVGERVEVPEPGLRTQWFENPKFLHHAKQQQKVKEQKSQAKDVISTRAKLQDATSSEEAYEILKDGFTSRVALLLHCDYSESERQKMTEMTSFDLGIDSLIAVAIRSWFFLEFGIDVPTFKILGGATFATLLSGVLKDLPADITPNMTT